MGLRQSQKKSNMRPYFQDELVTIYHGDCRDVLPTLPKVDLVLTDPPYQFSLLVKTELHALFTAVTDGDVIVFCPPENQWEFEGLTRRLFWVKPTSTKNYTRNYGRFVEMISVFKRSDVWNTDLNWANYTGIYSDILETESTHPNQKPASLIARFVRMHTDLHQTIVDPFMGSGTTLRTAKDLNRKAIGIEIEERYCEIAAKRMAQQAMAL